MSDDEPLGDGRPAYYVSVTTADFASEAAAMTVEPGASSRVDWYADGTVWVNGVRVREARWRRVLNWVWRRLA